MAVELSHPDGLLDQDDYAPVAVATGTRLVLLAGQTGIGVDGAVAATDLEGQVYAALHNIAIGLRAAGGQLGDVARLTVYVVDWSRDKWDAVLAAVARAQDTDGLAAPTPPLTVIGVQALFRPELLVEIEATAVLE